MSKRQRDSLIAEVERHRQQQRLQSSPGEAPPPLPYRSKESRNHSPHLLQPLVPSYPFHVEPEPPSTSPELHAYLDCSQGESQAMALAFRGPCASPVSSSSQGKRDSSGQSEGRGGFRPEPDLSFQGP